MLIDGRVVEEQKNYYVIDTPGGLIRSVLKGAIKQHHQRLLVGDTVLIEIFDTEGAEGIVRRLHPRRNKLKKPSVANVDRLFLVLTFKEPLLDLHFVDKCLFTASVNELPVTLVINKTDLLDTAERESMTNLFSYYDRFGYEWITTSSVTREGISALVERGRNETAVFAGASGVGKSSLLNVLLPHENLRIEELSKNTRRGKHTTTATRLYKISDNSYIADTPGFSCFDLPEISEAEAIDHFKDIDHFNTGCKFSDCSHSNEPGCCIREHVVSGEILQSRFESFRTIRAALAAGNNF